MKPLAGRGVFPSGFDLWNRQRPRRLLIRDFSGVSTTTSRKNAPKCFTTPSSPALRHSSKARGEGLILSQGKGKLRLEITPPGVPPGIAHLSCHSSIALTPLPSPQLSIKPALPWTGKFLSQAETLGEAIRHLAE